MRNQNVMRDAKCLEKFKINYTVCGMNGKYDFYDCIRDIAEHPVVLRMKLYPHHGTTNCYQHCVHVAYLQLSVVPFFSFRCKIGGERGDAS